MKKVLFSLFLASSAFIGDKKPTERPILYVKENCFFCKKVFQAIEDLPTKVEIRDVRQEKYRQELIAIGGKGQIPCLVIDGKALYESNAIITYFQEHLEIFQDEENSSTP